MKRLSALLICSALLLTGCAEDVKRESSLPETEEVTQTTAATTTTSAATTAKTTAPPVIVDDIPEEDENKLPEGYDYIVPTVGDLEAKIVIDESTEVDLLALVEEVGYELPGVDLESDDFYIGHKKYIESHYTGEVLEEWRSRNYFYKFAPDAYYCGSEHTDWLAVIEYNYGLQHSTYARFAHIKDGEIVYLSEVIEAPCMWNYSDGQLFNPANEKGICVYDVESRTISYISKADNGMELNVRWSDMYLVDDRYILFEHIRSKDDNGMYMYDRENGSVTELNDLYLDPMMHRYALHGDQLHCYDAENDRYTVYDLKTQESTRLDSDDLTKIQCFESGDYIVASADKARPYSVSAEVIGVTRKSDGAEKAFDLREYCDEDTILRNIYAEGDWLYLQTYDKILALNFRTSRIVELTGADTYRRISFENGHITLDSDGYTYAGKLSAPQIILRDYDGSAIVPDSTVTYGFDANNNATDSIFDPTIYSSPCPVVCNGRVWLTDPSDDTVKLYHTGDTVGGLTVKECRTVIDVMDSQSYFNGGYVTFDGSIEITGEAYLDTWGEFLSEKGDIFIELDDDCLFPTIDYSDYRANRRIHITEGITYPEEMTSLLPQDGSKVRVKAVVSGISAEYLHNSRRSGGVGTWAKLVSLELLPEDEPIISQK